MRYHYRVLIVNGCAHMSVKEWDAGYRSFRRYIGKKVSDFWFKLTVLLPIRCYRFRTGLTFLPSPLKTLD